MELVVGDKRWSRWSMRPWLALKRTGAPFTETVVRLRRPDSAERIAAAGAPAGKVPILKDGPLVVWDSLAICEHLADRFPGAALWPADPQARTLARCAAAEMHAGFPELRSRLSMDLGRREPLALDAEVAGEVRRVVALWSELRRRHAAGGAFLVGAWSIADAFFTPVATRFRSYGVELAAHGDDEGLAGAYAEALLAQPDYLDWERDALAET